MHHSDELEWPRTSQRCWWRRAEVRVQARANTTCDRTGSCPPDRMSESVGVLHEQRLLVVAVAVAVVVVAW